MIGTPSRKAAAPGVLLFLLLILVVTAPACAPARDAGTLLRDLESDDLEVRQDASEQLDEVLRKRDHRVFVRGADSDQPMVRVLSLMYLARIDTPEAKDALRGYLAFDRRALVPFNPIRMKPVSERTDSRLLVASLIHNGGGDPQAVAILTRGVDEGQPVDVLTGTCLGLGILRDPQGLPFLARMADHGETSVVRAAVQALGRIPDDAAVEALRKAAAHPAAEVRSEVLTALNAHDSAAAYALVRELAASDPDREVRSTALRQVGRDRSARTIEFLIDQLAKTDAALRPVVLEALGQQTGQALGPRPEAWRRWWSQHRDRFAGGRSGP